MYTSVSIARRYRLSMETVALQGGIPTNSALWLYCRSHFVLLPCTNVSGAKTPSAEQQQLFGASRFREGCVGPPAMGANLQRRPPKPLRSDRSRRSVTSVTQGGHGATAETQHRSTLRSSSRGQTVRTKMTGRSTGELYTPARGCYARMLGIPYIIQTG